MGTVRASNALTMGCLSRRRLQTAGRPRPSASAHISCCCASRIAVSEGPSMHVGLLLVVADVANFKALSKLPKCNKIMQRRKQCRLCKQARSIYFFINWL